jgi:hypothetical protein
MTELLLGRVLSVECSVREKAPDGNRGALKCSCINTGLDSPPQHRSALGAHKATPWPKFSGFAVTRPQRSEK